MNEIQRQPLLMETWRELSTSIQNLESVICNLDHLKIDSSDIRILGIKLQRQRDLIYKQINEEAKLKRVAPDRTSFKKDNI